MENEAELIAVVEVSNYSKQYLEDFMENTPTYGYTITKVKVKKIFKSLSGFNKDTISIYEPVYSYIVALGKKIQVTTGQYRPLKKGSSYVLFLKKLGSRNEYYCCGIEDGKYVLGDRADNLGNIDKFAPEDLEIGKIEEKYRSIYRDVIKKYGKAG